jgi:hypothetical protein
MTFTVSFDPLHLIGIIFLAYLASLAGNIVAGIIVGFRTPSLDGQKFYVLAGLATMALGMTIPKVIIALIASAVAMSMNDTAGAATLWAMGISGVIGFLFTLLVGSKARV